MVAANSINESVTGIVGFTSTSFTATPVTQYNVQLGGATSSTLAQAAPTATTGIPLVSAGAAANPAFSTASVAGGGTGAVSLTGVLTGNGTSPITASPVTQYAPVIGGASNAVASTSVGTAGQVLQSSGAGVNAAYSTATYPSTTTVSQVLYSSATNVVSGLATANRAVMTTTSTGVPVMTALATNGQLIIGSTAGAPAAASLTAGTNITITPGSNSITIDAAAGGLAQELFVATKGSTQSINATSATLTFTTEVTDQGANYSSSTYTAPATGVYLFSLCANFNTTSNVPDGQSFDADVNTSNRDYRVGHGYVTATGGGVGFAIGGSAICDMDAADTSLITVTTTDNFTFAATNASFGGGRLN
jgi:hypothetical protein